LKETERIIRQDNQFFWKIRERKQDIQLKKVEKSQEVKKQINETHRGFYMRPKKPPRNNIIMN
jgi:hypothetical protein